MLLLELGDSFCITTMSPLLTVAMVRVESARAGTAATAITAAAAAQAVRTRASNWTINPPPDQL